MQRGAETVHAGQYSGIDLFMQIAVTVRATQASAEAR
jgi:hypothetical protein